MNGVRPLLCGVELGGTKCVCLIGTGPEDILAQIAVPTSADPHETLRQIAGVLGNWKRMHGPFSAIGLASFGPVDLRAESRTLPATSTFAASWAPDTGAPLELLQDFGDVKFLGHYPDRIAKVG